MINLRVAIRGILNRFWRNSKGATAIEYGLIVALISVVLIVALTQVAISMNEMFNTASTTVDTATRTGGSASDTGNG